MEGKVVKVVTKGETTFVFHDDYCKNRTPEEVKAILDRIAIMSLPALRAANYKKKINSA